MSLRLINVAGMRNVDSGLKMLIETIYFWLVASQYYNKKEMQGKHCSLERKKRSIKVECWMEGGDKKYPSRLNLRLRNDIRLPPPLATIGSRSKKLSMEKY